MAHEMLMAAPQQLSPPQEWSLGLPQAAALIAIPCRFCALARLKWRWSDDDRVHPGRLWHDLLVAAGDLIVALAFTYRWRNSGERRQVLCGLFLMAGTVGLAGVPVYLAQRGRMTAPRGL